MKCSYCGGNIGIEDKVCPYCGRPNEHARQHQEDMRRYEAAFEETRRQVEERTSRFTGLAVPLTLAGIMLVLAIGSVIFNIKSYDIGRSMVRRDMVRQADVYQAQVDALIGEQDYLMLSAYYSNKRLYMLTDNDGGPLAGYEMVFRGADYYSRIFEILMVRMAEGNYRFSGERFETTCGELADDLNRLFSLEKESYYPESCYAADKLEVIAEIKAQTGALLETYAGFTPEERTQIQDMSKAKLTSLLEEKFAASMQEAQDEE